MGDQSTAIGTAGGTLLSVLAIPNSTILATVVLAAIGAVTSFFVSVFVKWLWKKITK